MVRNEPPSEEKMEKIIKQVTAKGKGPKKHVTGHDQHLHENDKSPHPNCRSAAGHALWEVDGQAARRIGNVGLEGVGLSSSCASGLVLVPTSPRMTLKYELHSLHLCFGMERRG